jgi:hypothetical protein
MIVTVDLGLFVGVGWTSVPTAPGRKMAAKSSASTTSSTFSVFGEPWNLTPSALHAFFSLRHA